MQTLTKENMKFSKEEQRKIDDVIDDLVDKVMLMSVVREPLNFHYACYNGDYKTVERLISLGVDINKEGSCERTPIHYAIEGSHPEIVRLLVDKGADLNKRDSWGKNAIEKAEYCHIMPHGRQILEYLKQEPTSKMIHII